MGRPDIVVLNADKETAQGTSSEELASNVFFIADLGFRNPPVAAFCAGNTDYDSIKEKIGDDIQGANTY